MMTQRSAALTLVFLFCVLAALSQQDDYEHGQLFVKLENTSALDISFDVADNQRIPASIQPLVKPYGLRTAAIPFRLPYPSLQHIWLLKFDSAHKAEALIKALNSLPDLEYAERVPTHTTSLTPNDLQPVQWGLSQINAELAWDLGTGNTNIAVAVVDDAVLLNHEDLAPVLWTNPGEIAGNGIDDDGNGYIDDVQGWDAADNDNDANPGPGVTDTYFSHGTHVAGIACAATDNGIGMASISHNISLIPVKIGANANSSLTGAMQGVEYAIAINAPVISMSWGGSGSSVTYQTLFDIAYANGQVCIAAAGNNNSSSLMYPASYNHVISVGATDASDMKASFSNYGSMVDVMAPGVGIYSATAGGISNYGLKSGTSMACPLVSGLAGLMLSKNANLTPDEVEACITSTCDNIDAVNGSYLGQIGAGRINAQQAMICVKPINADFSTLASVACVGGSIQFFDQSNNVPTSWEWTFPGGTPSTSTIEDPVVTYSTAGTYDVQLIAHNAAGSDTLLITDYVTVELASATLSGGGTAILGNTVFLQVDFTGPAPWSFVYSDGTDNDTINNITSSPLYLPVTPFVTTTYSAVSMSSAACTGTATGSAVVSVITPGTCNSVSGFQRAFGGTADENGHSIALTFDGGALLTGYTETWGAGGRDVYVVKLDECGNHEWSRAIGATGFDMGMAGSQLQDSGYVITGYTAHGGGTYDMYAMRLDAAGNLDWANNYGGSAWDYPRDIKVMSDGNFIMGGVTNSGAFTAGLNAFLCSKLDANGTVIWSNGYSTSTFNEFLHHIEPTNDGGAILCGYQRVQNASLPFKTLISKIDANGVLEWTKSYHGGVQDAGFGVVELNDGYVFMSSSNSDGVGQRDVQLIRTDLTGNVDWTNYYGTPGDEQCVDVVMRPDSGFYVGGYTTNFGGDRDVFLMSVSQNGTLLGSSLYGGTGEDDGSPVSNSMALRSDGSVLFVGSTNSMGAGGDDMYLIRTDVDGLLSCDSVSISMTQTSGSATAAVVNLTTIATGIVANNPLSSTVATTTTETIECEVISSTYCYGVKHEQKVSDTEGLFDALINNTDAFGSGLTDIGDLNGDGVPDMMAGALSDNEAGIDMGAIYTLFMNVDGTVDHYQKIASGIGGFTGITNGGGVFGVSAENIGDLNGDGTVDIAVGESAGNDGGQNRGGIWILFMNPDGTVNSHQKISQTQGGFGGTLPANCRFGSGIAKLPDLNGDGVIELAVGALFDNDGGTSRGAVWILMMNSDGTVSSEQKISSLQGGFTGVLNDNDRFGGSVQGIGDFNGDGIADIAVGASLDDDGGTDRGAIWLLYLNANGTVNGYTKISDTNGWQASALDDSDEFGSAISTIGDINSDGVTDLIVSATGDDDGASNNGAVYLLIMNSSGSVDGSFKISETSGSFEGTLDPGGRSGAVMSRIGDLDGNGIQDFAISSLSDDDGGSGRGAFWVVFLEDPCDALFCDQSSFELKYGGPGEDVGHTVINTSDGGMLLAGRTTSWGSGDYDYLLIKTDAEGTEEWSNVIGAGGDEAGSSISIAEASNGNYVLSGRSTSYGAVAFDGFNMMVDATGSVVWQHSIEGSLNDYARDIIASADGNLLMAGNANSQTLGGAPDCWLIKADNSGNILWTQNYGGPGNDQASALLQAPDSSIYILGTTYGFGAAVNAVYVIKTDADGNMLWSQTFDAGDRDSGVDFAFTSTYDLIITGLTRSFTNGSEDVLVMKIDSSGNEIWANAFGGTLDERGTSVVVQSNGDIAVMAHTTSFGNGSTDLLLLVLDQNGNLKWSKSYGTAATESAENAAKNLIETADGGLAMLGSANDGLAPLSEFYLVKTNACGESECNDQDVTVTQTPATFTAGTGGSSGTFTWTFTNNTPVETAATGLVADTICIVPPPYVCGLIAAGGADTTCVGDTTQFADFSSDPDANIIVWQWDFGDGNAQLGTQHPSHSYAAPGSYTATLIVGNDTTPACLDTITIPVLVTNDLAVVAPAGATICANDSTNLGPLAISCGSAPYTYSWSPTASLTDATSGTPTAFPDSTTTYVVTVTDNNGTTAVDSMLVTVDQTCCVTWANFTTNATDYCSGDSVYFTNTTIAPAGATYTWTFGPNATPAAYAGANPPAVYYDTSGTVSAQLIVTDTCGMDTMLQSFAINLALTAEAGPDTTVCAGDGAQLGIDLNMLAGYLWSPAANLSDATSNNPLATPPGSTQYYLTVTDLFTGCTTVDSVLVTIDSLCCATAANFSIDSLPYCAGDSMRVTNTTSALPAAVYTWSFSPNATPATFVGANPPAIFFDTTGTVSAQLIVSDSCGTDTLVQQAVINAGIPAEAGTDTLVCLPANVTLGGAANVLASYSWSPAATLSSATDANPVATPGASTTYTLTVTEVATGCISIDSVTISIDSACCSATANFVTDTGFYCPGDSVYITNMSSAQANATYTWTFSPNATPATFSGANPPAIFFDTTGTISAQLIVSDSCGTDTLVQQAVINTGIPADAGTDTLVCAPANVVLGGPANAQASYSWSPAGSLSSATAANPVATPTSNTTYTLAFTELATGCTTIDSVTVSIDSTCCSTTANFTTDSNSYCTGDSVYITNSSSAQANATYTWSFSPNATPSSFIGANPPAVYFDTTGAISAQLIVSDSCGTDTLVQAAVINSGIPANAGPDTLVCPPDSVQLGGVANILATYQWAPSATLSSAVASNPFASPTSSTTYFVTVTTFANGCTSTDSVTVGIDPACCTSIPTASFTMDGGLYCPEDSVYFTNTSTATAGATHTWVFSPNATPATFTGLNPPPVFFDTVGQVSAVLIVSDSCGSDTAEVTPVMVTTTTPAFAGNDTTVCIATSVMLGAPGVVTNFYQWAAAPSLSDTLAANPTATPTGTTEYTLTVTDQISTCVTYDTVVITVDSSCCTLIADFITNDPMYCMGDSVDITNASSAPASATYEWTFSPNASPASFTGANPPSVVFASPGTATIQLILTDSCGIDTVTQQVTMNNVPTAEAGPDTTICIGDTVQIGAVAIPVNTYLWSPLDSLAGPTLSLVDVWPATTTTYTVVVSDLSGQCTGIDSVEVTVENCCSLAAEIAPLTVEVCTDVVVLFTNETTGTTPATTFEWSFDATATPPTFSGESPPDVSFSTPGLYQVQMIATDPCATDSATATVEVIAGPESTFTSNLQPTCDGVLAELLTDSLNLDSLRWIFSAGNPATQAEVSRLFPYQSTMTTSLTVFDGGCSSTSTTTNEIGDFASWFDFTAPNVFSPNSDGINDYLEVGFGNKLYDCTELKVFNRWGQLMFISVGNYHTWDGRTFDGQEAPVGPYFYVLTINGLDYKGSATLLR